MDQDEEGEHMANVAFLIRARSVVQVHPGPPFDSQRCDRNHRFNSTFRRRLLRFAISLNETLQG